MTVSGMGALMPADASDLVYVVEVSTVLIDPNGEPIRLGVARYRATHRELTASDWPFTGAYPTVYPPIRHNFAPVTGKPSGAIQVEVSISLDPRREVGHARPH